MNTRDVINVPQVVAAKHQRLSFTVHNFGSHGMNEAALGEKNHRQQRHSRQNQGKPKPCRPAILPPGIGLQNARTPPSRLTPRSINPLNPTQRKVLSTLHRTRAIQSARTMPAIGDSE
jgi:hypothetical protein